MSALSAGEAAELAVELLATDGFAVASERASVNFRWAGSSLTTNGSTTQASVVVVAIHDGAVGTASTEGALDRPTITEVVARARAAAKDGSPAEDASPFVTPDEAGSATGLWSGAGPEVGLDGVGDFTARLGRLFGSVGGSDYALYGFAHQELTSTWLATSTGIRLRHDQPSGTVAATGRSRDAKRSTWAGVQARDLSMVDVQALGAEIEMRLGWARHSVEVGTGRQEVILSSSAVSDLAVVMHWSMSGRDAAEGRSAFSRPAGATKLGERIGPAGLQMVSDPADPRMTCMPFHVATSSGSTQSVFDTGLGVGRTTWISDGIFSNLIETRAGARESGRPFALPADNLILDGGGTKSLQEMIASTERALLVNSLWYIREVDPVSMLLTGLTRDGVYLIEDGEVVGATSNFRWNDSPISVLGRVLESGAAQLCVPREWGDDWERAIMSPLRVADFNMSSVSEAI